MDEYYNSKILNGDGLFRYLRLFSELPPDSRCIIRLSPVESWSVSDETNSLILQELRTISSSYYNTHRKKGAKSIKVTEQFQPEYVKTAKEEYRKHIDGEKSNDIDDDTKAFWEHRTGIKINKSSK